MVTRMIQYLRKGLGWHNIFVTGVAIGPQISQNHQLCLQAVPFQMQKKNGPGDTNNLKQLI